MLQVLPSPKSGRIETAALFQVSMVTRDFEIERKEAEAALKFADESFGANHPMVAARLENLAQVLKDEGKSLLEAANLEARAKVIRSKFENDEILSGSHQIGKDYKAGEDSEITANNSMSQYTIISKIGSGGMGTVYKAKHVKIEKFLAVKILSSELVSSKSTRRRFEQEVQASCNLTHPHLVSVYDFGISDRGAPYMVMDFIDGITLAQEIKDLGFIEKERALNIAIQLCEGISHAHSRSILHRDIKPSNIMLTETGENKDFIKVVDFGLAKLMPSSGTEGKTMTSTTDVMGSPFYMSPEQCLGEQLDQRSDIYAIGCVLHEMFTGKPPFSSGNTIKIIFQHLNADRTALLKRMHKFKLQAGMEKIILRCLQKNAKDRYQSTNDLLKDLNLVKSGRAPGLAANSKSRMKLAVGAAAIVLSGALGAVFMMRQQPAPVSSAATIPTTSAVISASTAAAGATGSAAGPARGPAAAPAASSPVAASPASAGLSTLAPVYPKPVSGSLSYSKQLSHTQTGTPEASEDQVYENIDVKDNMTYKLVPGKHFVSKMKVSGSGKVVLSGSTRLVFKGDYGAPVEISGDARVNTPGDPELLEIVYKGEQPIRVADTSKLSARINARNSIAIVRGDAEMILSNNSSIPKKSNLYMVGDYPSSHLFANEDMQQAYIKEQQEKQNAQTRAQQQALQRSYQQAMAQAQAQRAALIEEQNRARARALTQSPARVNQSSSSANTGSSKSLEECREDYARRIQRNWNGNARIIIARFKLDSEGNIYDLRIVNGSNDKEQDNTARAAISAASPLPTPPESYANNSFTVFFRNGSVQVL